MPTLEFELDQLETKHNLAMDAVRLKHHVISMLPEGGDYTAPHVSILTLWDTPASIHYRHQDNPFAHKGENPDVALLRNPLKALPPIATVLVNDGCKSFRPWGTWKGSCSDVYPVTIRIQSYPTKKAEVMWHGHADDGRVIRVHVELPIVPKLGDLRIEYSPESCNHRESRVMSCSFHNKVNANLIKWAAGDGFHPNDFTLYWDSASVQDLPGIWE